MARIVKSYNLPKGEVKTKHYHRTNEEYRKGHTSVSIWKNTDTLLKQLVWIRRGDSKAEILDELIKSELEREDGALVEAAERKYPSEPPPMPEQPTEG